MIEYFRELVSNPAAILGLVASLVVLVSMCFDTRTRKGDLLLRAWNLAGSVLSVTYGIILGPAGFGMIILNGTLVFVNVYYLIKIRGEIYDVE